MTATLSTRLYRRIILLYPEPFRREFGAEMLGVFNECRATQKISRLLADALIAALKQQLHYLATPAPAPTALYAEVPSSPGLARHLAMAVVAIAVSVGVFAPHKEPKTHAWATLRVEHRIWYLQRGDLATARKPFTSTPQKDE